MSECIKQYKGELYNHVDGMAFSKEFTVTIINLMRDVYRRCYIRDHRK